MSTSTLGIDLAAERRNTAVCIIRWKAGSATVESARLGSASEPLDNQVLPELMLRADATGIDAPFGWPRRFVAAVSAWSETATWPELWDTEARPADKWLTLGPHAPELTRTDHALDALISAIVARAASLGRTEPVPSDLRADAKAEGWIHVPAVMPSKLVD